MRCKIAVILGIIFVFLPVNNLYAYTNDANNLLVTKIERVTLSGYHKYLNSVIIDGTVILPESDGMLTLEAPSISIGPKGIIDGNAKGYLDGPGAGEDSNPCSDCDWQIELTGGGGYGGRGGDGICCANGGHKPYWGGLPYGTSWFPDIDMGSGGGKNFLDYYARGGGAIKLVASKEIIIRGTLTVNGGHGDGYTSYPLCSNGCGSGGGILLMAPVVILRAQLSARGGTLDCAYAGLTAAGGGGGRIKVFYWEGYYDFYSVFDVSPGFVASFDGIWYREYPTRGTVSIIDMRGFPYYK